jgi:hypothetical protein
VLPLAALLGRNGNGRELLDSGRETPRAKTESQFRQFASYPEPLRAQRLEDVNGWDVVYRSIDERPAF